MLLSLFQTSTSLPKTSYFKMVDVWLLFSISVIFFVIVFHVIIDMAADGKLTGDFSRNPTTVKVIPLEMNEKLSSPSFSPSSRPDPRRMMLNRLLSAGGNSPDERKRLLSDKLFRQALIFVPSYFMLFNVIYWIYIFA